MKIEKPISSNKLPIETPPPASQDDFDDVWADLRDAKREEFHFRGLLQRANPAKKNTK